MKTEKLLVLFVLNLLFFASCERNNYLDLNGKLKHISYVESIESKKGGMIIAQYEYDKHGRISKVSQPKYENGTSMYENGTIIGLLSYSDYVYNKKGLLEKIIYYNSNIYEGFINLQTHTYSYDKNGNKQKEVIEYPRAAPFQTDSTLYYYDNNRLIREDKYSDGYYGSEIWTSKLIAYTEYEYDNQGRLVKETNYSGTDNTPLQFSVHSYQNGLNVKTEIFNSNNEQKIREIRRHYDKNSNLIYLEHEELSIYSSSMSYVAKYDYY